MYGLEHGRLHLRVPTPMWMNMGYWGADGCEQKTLAEACRDLLNVVLCEAGLGRKSPDKEDGGEKRKRVLVDVGMGCGEQTIYLLSPGPVRECDKEWWDERRHCVRFDAYVGITKDGMQARYATKRVDELISRLQQNQQTEDKKTKVDIPVISIFQADASNPNNWNSTIQYSISPFPKEKTDTYLLALDTLYHFSPSRFNLLKHFSPTHFNATFLAFDLCLSPTATFSQILLLRLLTTLMGAPWANFVTPAEYRARLVEMGYDGEEVVVKDVSERVFGPLAEYLEMQDRKLKALGWGIGKFGVAKWMFGWWGRSGVVRGVVVVAKK